MINKTHLFTHLRAAGKANKGHETNSDTREVIIDRGAERAAQLMIILVMLAAISILALLTGCADPMAARHASAPIAAAREATTNVADLKGYLERDRSDLTVLAAETHLSTNSEDVDAITDLVANNIQESNVIVALETNLATVVQDNSATHIQLTKTVAAKASDDARLTEDSKIITGFVLLFAIAVTSGVSWRVRGLVGTPPSWIGIAIVALIDAITFAAACALAVEGLHLFGTPFPAIFGK
jgi:hypothetical protein